MNDGLLLWSAIVMGGGRRRIGGVMGRGRSLMLLTHGVRGGVRVGASCVALGVTFPFILPP